MGLMAVSAPSLLRAKPRGALALLGIVSLAVPPYSEASAQGAAPAQDIHLICEGTASIKRDVQIATLSESGQGSDNTGGTYTYSGSGSVTAPRTVSQHDEIMVDVTGAGGRIRIPDSWLPPLHTRAADGWRKLNSLTVSDTEIRGRFEINFLLRPTVVISRLTGRIDVVGQGRFAGECQPYQPGDAVRRF